MNEQEQARLEQRLRELNRRANTGGNGGTRTLADSEAELMKGYEIRKKGEQAFSRFLDGILSRYR